MFASVLRRREFLVGAAACLGAAALGRPLSAQGSLSDQDLEVSAEHTEDFRESLDEWIDSSGNLNWTEVGYRRGDVGVPYGGRRAVHFGPGRHEIRDRIVLRSRQVLRGAGPERTTLYFPEGLTGMGYPASEAGRPSWDWWGGVIEARRATEVGIEDLTIEFPPHRYQHHGGKGYNGPNFVGSQNCWVKNVAIVNADVGISFHGTHHCTAQDIRVVANRYGCHMHVNMTAATDNLVMNFDVEGRSIHGLAGNWGAHRCVFAGGACGGGESRLTVEPDHNGPRSTGFLYTYIEANAVRVQRRSDAVLWNVGLEHPKMPHNLYQAQMLAFKGRSL